MAGQSAGRYALLDSDTCDSSSSESTRRVFCIHGNKWGVATCCEDLEQGGSEHEPMLGYNSLEEQARGPESLHCHTSRQDGIDKEARRKLLTASVLCLIFMIAEIVGGVLSNSLAIASDAAHLLSDFASFLISLFALHMAAKPKSQKMSFGWHRAEVLGATVSVLMIWLVTGILVYMAVLRVIHQDFNINTNVMLITSGCGILVNLLMAKTLHQHGHSHGGDHGHSHGVEEGLASGQKKSRININVSAAFIHVVGDILQSLGVFIAAIVIYFKPEWSIVDPICTFFFSVLVLYTTINILRKTLGILLAATPKTVNYDVVKNTFLSVKGIRQVHNLRIWDLTTNKTALAAHLAVDKGMGTQEVLQEATKKIREKYELYEMTLQIEEFEDDMEACDQCKDPVE